MKSKLIFLALLLHAGLAYAQGETNLIGLPFKARTPDSVIKKIVVEQFTDLRHMGTTIEAFRKYKNHKVLAVNYDLTTDMSDRPYYYLGAWGGAWEWSTLDSAKTEAMKQVITAPNYNAGRKIHLLVIDDSLNIPDSFYIKWKQSELDLANNETRRFELANKITPLNDAADITRSMVDVQNGRAGNRGDSIRLLPHFPLRLGYPDEIRDYAEACQDRVFYAFKEISSIDTGFYFDELRQLARRGLYGAYDRSVNTVMDYRVYIPGRQMERMAKFSSHVMVKQDSVEFKLPWNLKDVLEKDSIQELWVEGAVQITDDGIPLAKDTISKPLAMKMNGKLYVAIEIRMPNTGSYCSISQDFQDKIMDLTVYRDDEDSRQRIYETLMKNIEVVFSVKPFVAQKIRKPYPPGEMWMIRDGLPSLILGGPYYESSTYTFKIYYAGEGGGDIESLYNHQSFKGVGKKDIASQHVFLYMEVNNVSSSKAHKNDPLYVDLSKDDQGKYFREINSAVQRAIQQTCDELKGKFKATICEFKKISK